MTETEAVAAFANLPAIIGLLTDFQERLVEAETDAAAERLRLGLRILRLEQENASLRDTLEGWADAGHHNAALKAQAQA